MINLLSFGGLRRQKKNISYFLDKAGAKYFFDELIDGVPELIFLGPLHVDVCRKIAQLKGFTGEHYKVYVNLLVSHSRYAENITALIILIQKKEIGLTFVQSKYVVKELLQEFLPVEGVNFSATTLDKISFFPSNVVGKLFLKMSFHKIYRCLFNKKNKQESIIRSWVEISQKMHGDYYDKSLILIYPFYLNYPRHIAYIKNCFRTYNCVAFCGLPYRIMDWLRIILEPKNRDLGYVNFEYNAYQEHAAELASMGCKKLYTSDEFEAGAVVMASKLRSLGGEVINKAHGLSFGSPFLAYNKFTVYNTAQKEYYERYSRTTNFEVAPRINAGQADMMEVSSAGPTVLVYIEANFKRFGIKYESDLEERSIREIRIFAKKIGVRAVIKAHPNRSASDYSLLAKETEVQVIKHLNEINKTRPIFITIASAAYYDFKPYGPFVFVDDGYSDLHDFYGEKLESYSVEELSIGMEKCLSVSI